MFDFEKLLVNKKAKSFNHSVRLMIVENQLDNISKNQLSRATKESVSVVFECVTLLHSHSNSNCPHPHTLTNPIVY